MVSMRDIAKKCNVSVATVSKALNNHSDISEETKKRIQQVAAKLGYYPNSAARALKTNRSYNIGVLLDDKANSGLTHEYFSAVLEGVKVEAESCGYDITFINTHSKTMTYYEHCKYRNLDGVVIACTDFEGEEVKEVVNGTIPSVTIDYVFNNCTSVSSDNVRGMRDLVNYVYKMGHRKIAYIHGEIDSEVTKERLASFYRTLEELKVEIPDEYVKSSEYLNSVKAEQLTYELLDMKDAPTCIFYPDDLSYTGGLNAVRKKGLKVPADISTVGYDGIKLSQMLSPRLTTLQQNTLDIGRNAARELIAAIEHPKTTLIKRIVVEGNLIEGETVKEIK